MTKDQGLFIVVAASATTGTTIQATPSTNLLATFTEYYALQNNFVSHHLVPAFKVILISGKTVNKEPAVRVLGGLHGTVDEAAGDLHGDDGAVLDMRLDQLAILRAGLGAFLAQQVAGRQMNITVPLDDVAAEGTLAGAWAA